MKIPKWLSLQEYFTPEMDKVIDICTGGLTITKVDESQIRWQNGLVGKLHALTGSLLFLFSVSLFAKELLGDHIKCTRCNKNGMCKMLCYGTVIILFQTRCRLRTCQWGHIQLVLLHQWHLYPGRGAGDRGVSWSGAWQEGRGEYACVPFLLSVGAFPTSNTGSNVMQTGCPTKSNHVLIMIRWRVFDLPLKLLSYIKFLF